MPVDHEIGFFFDSEGGEMQSEEAHMELEENEGVPLRFGMRSSVITVSQRMEIVNRFLRDFGKSSQDLVGGYHALVNHVNSDLGDEAGTKEAI